MGRFTFDEVAGSYGIQALMRGLPTGVSCRVYPSQSFPGRFTVRRWTGESDRPRMSSHKSYGDALDAAFRWAKKHYASATHEQHITVDGKPLCELPRLAYMSRLKAAGDPTCTHSTIAKAIKAAQRLRVQLPGRVGVMLCGCPHATGGAS